MHQFWVFFIKIKISFVFLQLDRDKLLDQKHLSLSLRIDQFELHQSEIIKSQQTQISQQQQQVEQRLVELVQMLKQVSVVCV